MSKLIQLVELFVGKLGKLLNNITCNKMSLINFDHSNSSQPMFFGESPALQRYDQPKYPILEKIYDTQLSYFWSPQEISLAKDRIDFQNLTEQEKFIFTSNLKYQKNLVFQKIGRAHV